MPRILAAADIGSNTVHMLVGSTDGALVTRLDNVSEWIALGEAVARSGSIADERVDQLVAAMRECQRVAQARKAERFYVFATEAMRSAANLEMVLKRIKKDVGLKVNVISPQKEVELCFLGSLLDMPPEPWELFFDLGGGSGQVSTWERGNLKKHVSLPIGTGRIIAHADLQNPCPSEAVFKATHYVREQLSKVEFTVGKGVKAVASGGVVRGLWRALHPDGEKSLARREIDFLIWTASRLPADRLASRYSVKQRRAQTLLPGAIAYSAMMEHFGLEEIAISEFGVREGAILEMARGNL
jgi:exopolyphosphatase / guanosine-5'-triphosphate,3'-diphosphate pyrophosphatase